MLTPYLTPENADELFAAATRQSKAGIERLLAERFPRPDLPPRIEALAPRRLTGQLSPGTVGARRGNWLRSQLSPTECECSQGLSHAVRSRVAPLAPGRYALQLTVGQATYEKLRHAQALLGHAVPSGELAEVFDRALDALIARLEQRKCAATARPRPRRQASANARHVPAAARRAVWERDGGRCTFVSVAGHRCAARHRLEFDHVEPVARGGRATAKGMRLRCRAHNQYAAECAFGAGFMEPEARGGSGAEAQAARRQSPRRGRRRGGTRPCGSGGGSRALAASARAARQ